MRVRRFVPAFAWMLFAALFFLAQLNAGQNSLSDAEKAGLIELVSLDPSFALDIRYATPNNFTGQVVYPSAKCYLRRDVALALAEVQKDLRDQGLGLKIYDGYRPFDIQKKFWAIMPNESYVAKPVEADGKPVEGSKHNRGAAVDLTLVDSQGQELEMPSGYDDFTDKASRECKQCTPQAKANLKILETAMRKRGFSPLPSEWWHFDGPGWEQYEILNIPLD